MTRAEALRLLDELKTTRGSAALTIRWQLSHALEHADATLLDRETFAEIAGALARHGASSIAAWRARPLVPGESYVLVADELSGAGHVARVRITTQPGRTVVAPELARDAHEHTRNARRGLASTLAGMRCGPVTAKAGIDVRFATKSWTAALRVDGPSLGLAVAVATLSAWLERPALSNVAGSAQVDPEGHLHPVGRIGEKLAALRRFWPNVEVVVVAAEQDELPAHLERELTVVRHAHLKDALAAFGLHADPAMLAPIQPHEARLQLEALELRDGSQMHGHDDWHALAERALWLGDVLLAAGPPHTPHGVRARGTAALFLLHAGDARGSDRLLLDIKDRHADLVSELDLPARVALRIIEAAKAIDLDPDGAVAVADAAVADAALLPIQSRREFYGRALGTLGRALMHAGRLDEAIAKLTEAADFHARHDPAQEVRSRFYQATCERLRGRASAARAVLEKALAQARSGAHPEALDSVPFIELELGRCLVAAGCHKEAEPFFADVVSQSSSDRDYPRLSGLRGLAAVARQRGDETCERALLERCIAVAEVPELGFKRQVAAYAVGDALLAAEERGTSVLPLETLRALWRRCFDGDASPIAVREVLRRAIY